MLTDISNNEIFQNQQMIAPPAPPPLRALVPGEYWLAKRISRAGRRIGSDASVPHALGQDYRRKDLMGKTKVDAR